MEPRTTYKARIYTTNSTGWPGVTHIVGRDFSPVIETAKAMPGFKETKPAKNILTGFGHASVISVAPAVIDAAKKGVLVRAAAPNARPPPAPRVLHRRDRAPPRIRRSASC